MRIIFDQGTPHPLRRHLTGHLVSVASEIGWSELENGDLLREAEDRFDLLVTTDKNILYQQNLEGRHLAILVLPETRWRIILAHVAAVVEAVNAIQPGEYRQLWW